MSVRTQQADFVRNDFAHELTDFACASVGDDASNDIAFAPYRTHDNRFASSASAAHSAASARSFVLVLGFAADKRFIHFNYADQLAKLLLLQASANAMTHVPRGFVAAESECAEDLQCADSFLARHHQMDDAEPIAQRLVR